MVFLSGRNLTQSQLSWSMLVADSQYRNPAPLSRFGGGYPPSWSNLRWRSNRGDRWSGWVKGSGRLATAQRNRRGLIAKKQGGQLVQRHVDGFRYLGRELREGCWLLFDIDCGQRDLNAQ
ncbi:hypothetical protein U1Q18_042795 [Sarracenia purpurea var. burkii]